MPAYSNISRSLHKGFYRPDIDGLRGIAVSLVVITHAFSRLLPGGFIGVDIFFVISGYLISGIIIQGLIRKQFSFLDFYQKRARRIFPALIVILCLTLGIGWLVLFKPEFQALGTHVAASTSFAENLLLWNEASYFDVSSELKPTLHLWSLAIEEQFYLLWPLLLYFGHRMRIRPAWLIGIIGGVSFIVSLHTSYSNPTAAYYSPLGRTWELMSGACLAAYEKSRHNAESQPKHLLSLTGFAMIIVALFYIGPTSPFPGTWALLPTLGACAVIASGSKSWVNSRLLSVRPLVWIGTISYSLYLFHWPLISFAHIIFGRISYKLGATCIILAVCLAAVTVRFVEIPFRSDRRPRTVPALFAVMGMIFLSGFAISKTQVAPRITWVDPPTKNEWSFLKRDDAKGDKGTIGEYTLGKDRSEKVLFVGDSHVAQYASRIAQVIASHPTAPGAVMEVGGGCIPIRGVQTEDLRWNKCTDFIEKAYKVAETGPYETVVVGGAWNVDFFSDDFYITDAEAREPLSSKRGRIAALEQLGRDIKILQQSGKKVILLLDNPRSVDFVPGSQAIRLHLSPNSASTSITAKIASEQLQLRGELVDWAKSHGARVVDPFAAVCSNDTCEVTTKAGQPLYKDMAHFNPDWTVNNATFIDSVLY
jgi:peptidoglycan/LPS O-acetylase OafA/YrhL